MSEQAVGLGAAVPLLDDAGVAGDRTLEILERRRRTAVVKRRGWLVRRLLVLADVAGLMSAFLIAEWLAAPGGAGADRIGERTESLLFALTLPVWIAAARLYGLYDRDEERADHSTVDELAGVFHLVAVGTWVLFASMWTTGVAEPHPPKLLFFSATAVVTVAALRAGARGLARRSIAYLQNAVVVGTAETGSVIAAKLARHPEYGINLVGLVLVGADEGPAASRGPLRVLGAAASLPALIRLFDVERVVIASTSARPDEISDLVGQLRDLDVRVDLALPFFEASGPKLALHSIEELTLVALPPLRIGRSSLAVKRTLDVVTATLGLLLLSPLLAVVALAVRLDSRGPALYRDRRIGRDGKTFHLLKFRTMHVEYCAGPGRGDGEEALDDLLASDGALREEFERTHKLRRDPRVTRVGRILRRWSLDELPQLVNVLRGDLSAVGPRAVTAYEFERFCRDRASVTPYWEVKGLRPGVTGYWQINGRSSTSYRERLRLDLAYVSSWSLALDLEILAKTARALVRRNGAY